MKLFKGVDFDEKGNIVKEPSKGNDGIEYRVKNYVTPVFSDMHKAPNDAWWSSYDRVREAARVSSPPITPVSAIWPPQHPSQQTVTAYKSTELDLMPENQFLDLIDRVTAETARRKRRHFDNPACRVKFSNFMLGVTHAMACRAALRWGLGHRPYSPDGKGSGGTPSSGECWNIFDVAKLDNKILTTSGFSTGGAVVDGKKSYIVNINPMTIEPSSLSRWLCKSALISWPCGSRMISNRDV